MKILLLTAHSIAEFDDLRMLSEMGHEVLSIGAYLDPANPADDKRPALPQVPPAPKELRDLVADQMAAKSALPDSVLDWAEVVICHHFPAGAPDNRPGWITGNWSRFKAHGNRVIWRTCGQSNPAIERIMGAVRADGLEIVRYSPLEENLPNYAGHDAIIRFGKEPDEWCGWTGEEAVVGNVTQDMLKRAESTGFGFWVEATKGLPRSPAGPGSAEIGGVGSLSYDEMRAYLRRLRVYLYTGTQPASYTLGLIEAMMTGVPVVSVGPTAFGSGWVGRVYEGHTIVGHSFNEPLGANTFLCWLLEDLDSAVAISQGVRKRATDLFGMARVKEQWAALL